MPAYAVGALIVVLAVLIVVAVAWLLLAGRFSDEPFLPVRRPWWVR